MNQPLVLQSGDFASGSETELEEVEGRVARRNADVETSNQRGTEAGEVPLLAETGASLLDEVPPPGAYQVVVVYGNRHQSATLTTTQADQTAATVQLPGRKAVPKFNF